MRIIIPVAGRGSRAKLAHGNIPKCLVKISDKPIIRHILEYVEPMDFSEIRVVVGPHNGDRIKSYLDREFDYWNLKYYEQPEPIGEGNAVWCAMPDIKYDKEPVLVILGDIVPAGRGSEIFQARMAYDDTRKPAYSLLGTKQRENPTECTMIKLDSRRFVESFKELRDGSSAEGTQTILSGVHYIRRGDYLYDALNNLRKGKVVLADEYRLTSGFKLMRQFGEGFYSDTIETRSWC